MEKNGEAKLVVVRESTVIFKKWASVTYELFKIMLPMLIVVKIIDSLGGVAILGTLLNPVMEFVGLPGAMGLVWASAIFSNVQTALAVYIILAQDYPLTQAQVTILMSLVLIVHNLPVEQQVAYKVGMRWIPNVIIRISLGLGYGYILMHLYRFFDLLQDVPAYNFFEWLSVISMTEEASILIWLWDTLKLLGFISLMILLLVALFRMLELLGILAWLEFYLARMLLPLGVGKQFTSIASIGFILGVSYGVGFIIAEIKNRKWDSQADRQIFLLMTLLAGAHGVLEDTLLVMAVGAHISGVFFGRILFVVTIVFILKFLVFNVTDNVFYRYCFLKRQPLKE